MEGAMKTKPPDIFDEKFAQSNMECFNVIKQDAIDKCITLGKKFISAFEKWYDENSKQKPTSNFFNNNMLLYMRGLYRSANKIILYTLHRKALHGEMWDWFFSAGGDFRDFLKNPTPDKVFFYDNMVTKILNGKDIRPAF